MNPRIYFYINIEHCLCLLLEYVLYYQYNIKHNNLLITIRSFNNKILIHDDIDRNNQLTVYTDRPNISIKTMSRSIYYNLKKYRIYFRVYNCWEGDEIHRVYCKYLKHKREYDGLIRVLRQKRKKLFPLNDILFFFK
jgi:hypothetical protein